MTKPLTEQTPAEIDEQIAQIEAQRSQQAALLYRATQALKKRNPLDPDKLRTNIETAEAKLRELTDQLIPFNEECDRRGGWNRVFVVVDGHIHSTTACRNGYYITTDWRWIPNQSGRDWDDIMAEAGERMCSWCFPSAPTEYRERTSTIEHPAETERREAKEARDAEKARKQAIADAKKVFDPDTGEQVRTYDGDLIKTERTVKSEIVDCLFWACLARAQRNDDGAEADQREQHARWLAHALAVKQGKDEDKLYDECVKKSRK